MTDEARTALMIALWLVSLALAFASGWVWRNGRLAELRAAEARHDEARRNAPVILKVPRSAIDQVEVVSASPNGVLLTPKLDGSVPVRGSGWESELDWERRQGAAQARATPS